MCCVNSYFHRKRLSSEQKQKHRLMQEERKHRDTSHAVVWSPVSCYLLISCDRVLEKG